MRRLLAHLFILIGLFNGLSKSTDHNNLAAIACFTCAIALYLSKYTED